jgi:hypothetical protein
MKTNTKSNTPGCLGVALVTLLAINASADTIIFDNSSNDLLTRLNPGTLEVGDQIVLANTERSITFFRFEYYGLSANPNPLLFTGANVEARVRFYENDGTPFNGYATPGTVLYDSSWFSVGAPTERNTFIFTAGSDFPTGGVYIPANEMTWSIQFQGLGAGDELGVDIYGPGTVGLNYPDYWENNGGNWSLMTNSVPMNFAVQIEAVPEPSSLSLLVLSGLGFLCVRCRVRRS